jgi:DNA-binding MarR family transcriptional regulator
MRAGALADAIHSDASTVSRQVADLVREGLVERRADPHDGRASVLVVTDKAERMVDEALQHRDAYLADLLADWKGDDVKELARLLGRLTGALETQKHALACGGPSDQH